MEFPFIHISTIIADVRGELSKRDRAGIINDDDCLGWIIEVMREIGGSNYQSKGLIAQVKNHTYVLPKDFYKAKKIQLLDPGDRSTWQQIGNSTIWFTEEEGHNLPCTNVIFPGDSFTANQYCTNRFINDDVKRPAYVIKHPNIFRVSLPSCLVAIEYLAIPKDEHGYLIQDEVYTLKAAKAFCKVKLLHEDYIDQIIPRYIYMDLQKECDDNVSQAQAIFKFPDPVDDKARGLEQNHRYDMYKFR